MKILHQKTLVAVMLAALVIGMWDCVTYPDNTWLVEVTDKKSGIEDWELEYDYKGRLVRYGNMPITYARGSVLIHFVRDDEPQDGMISAFFRLCDGRACKSEVRCLVEKDSTEVKAHKITEYEWHGDTLVMSSVWRSAENGCLLRKSEARYVYDTENRLTEAITSSTDAEGKEASCHSYYEYGNNIRYTANLNLQAFFVDREGWDAFFFFLLNMSGRPQAFALPNRIRHCVNHGDAMYIADGLYRLEGERPVRLEIISEEAKLKARYEFGYYH